uniref:Uncharacterized protein n=1 Tax=Anguilla anguilla TaxID=7936 RepID=A0A0E9V265_ANGAN
MVPQNTKPYHGHVKIQQIELTQATVYVSSVFFMLSVISKHK